MITFAFETSQPSRDDTTPETVRFWATDGKESSGELLVVLKGAVEDRDLVRLEELVDELAEPSK